MFKKYLVEIIKKSPLIIGGIALVISIITFPGVPRRESFEPTKSWVLSQGLYSNLKKQEEVVRENIFGDLTEERMAEIATSSSKIQGEAVIIDEKEVWLSTGSNGKVSGTIPYGKYSVRVLKVDGVDIRGIPEEVVISEKVSEMNFGFSKGFGLTVENPVKLGNIPKSDQRGVINISLFNDHNKNGVKDEGETDLSWAHVITVLERK